MSQHSRQPDAQQIVTPRSAATWTGWWAPMLLDRLRVAAIAVAVAVIAAVGVAPASFAGDDDDEGRVRHLRRAQASKSSVDAEERLQDVLRAQELYEGAVAAGKATPYMAPHPDARGGARYLWGGLDPIALLKHYDREIATDPGGVVFISGKKQLGRLQRDATVGGGPLPVVLSDGTTVEALFQSDDHIKQFRKMTRNGSLIIAFGMNCGWGVIVGPVSDFTSLSHFAQPGLAAINVERFREGTVTVLGVNFYVRGDDWKATQERWQYAVEALELLAKNGEGWKLDRVRDGVPVTELK